MSNIYIYYNQQGKRIHIKAFSNLSDMFYWCEMNCRRIKGNYYMNGNKILCGCTKE